MTKFKKWAAVTISDSRRNTMLEIVFFPNGNTLVFKDGQLMPDLNKSWFLLYIKFLTAIGIDPTEVKFIMPDAKQATVFEIQSKPYSWSIAQPVAEGR